VITALVGAQYGSEGKGLVAGHIASSYNVHVRVGAANAGHTVWVDGERHVLQQLPCAAYANPWANLVLGAGAIISQHVLQREVEQNERWRDTKRYPPLRLFIDYRAHVVTPEQVELEQQSRLAESIGSTSTIAKEGIGACQAARVMRERFLTAQVAGLSEYGVICDTVQQLHDAMIFGSDILLEGTQGTGLSNSTGQYPYVTSRNTTAAGLCADTGIGPRQLTGVIMVCRTAPIRVAGNSGPFWHDSRELSWQDLGIDPQQEKTTVTKRVRRVATFSYEQVRQAQKINSATEIALTFADYLAPDIRGKSGFIDADQFDQYDYVSEMVQKIERTTYTPVTLVGTGPQTVLEREPRMRAIEVQHHPV